MKRSLKFLNLCDYIQTQTSSQKLLLLFLAKSADGNGRSYHSVDSISKRTQLHHATIHSGKTYLKSLGILDWQRRTNQYNHQANLYELSLPRMEELAAQGKEHFETSRKATSQTSDISNHATSQKSDMSPTQNDMSPTEVDIVGKPTLEPYSVVEPTSLFEPSSSLEPAGSDPSAEIERGKQAPISAETSAASTRHAVSLGRDPARTVRSQTALLSIAGSRFQSPAEWTASIRRCGTFPDSDEPRPYTLKTDGRYATGTAWVFWQNDHWEVVEVTNGERLVQP